MRDRLEFFSHLARDNWKRGCQFQSLRNDLHHHLRFLKLHPEMLNCRIIALLDLRYFDSTIARVTVAMASCLQPAIELDMEPCVEAWQLRNVGLFSLRIRYPLSQRCNSHWIRLRCEIVDMNCLLRSTDILVALDGTGGVSAVGVPPLLKPQRME